MTEKWTKLFQFYSCIVYLTTISLSLIIHNDVKLPLRMRPPRPSSSESKIRLWILCMYEHHHGLVWRFLFDFWFKLLIEFHSVGAKANTVKSEKGFVCSLLIINFQWDFEYITWHLRRRRLFDLLFSLTHSSILPFFTLFSSRCFFLTSILHIFLWKIHSIRAREREKCLFATSI